MTTLVTVKFSITKIRITPEGTERPEGANDKEFQDFKSQLSVLVNVDVEKCTF